MCVNMSNFEGFRGRGELKRDKSSKEFRNEPLCGILSEFGVPREAQNQKNECRREVYLDEKHKDFRGVS